MAHIDLTELPPELAVHVARRARLTSPPQGKTSNVAFAEHVSMDAGGRATQGAVAGDGVVVVKRCAHRIYLDWLRREQGVLRALAGSGLPIPQLIGYAEGGDGGQAVGWLLMSRLPGVPFLAAAIAAQPRVREAMFRRLGELVRRMHATRVPPELQQSGSWLSRQIEQARNNLPWCDGTAAGLAELDRARPAPVPETLIHGDLALDNVLVDERGQLRLIDWAGGGSGDPRHDIALALQTKPELTLSAEELDAFFAGYGSAAPDEHTLDWFVRLYDYF